MVQFYLDFKWNVQMKKLVPLIYVAFAVFCIPSCKNNKSKEAGKVNTVDENSAFAADQYGLLLQSIETSTELQNPKSFINGKMKIIPPQEWTSGFSPAVCGMFLSIMPIIISWKH
jgi:hypothetical protein